MSARVIDLAAARRARASHNTRLSPETARLERLRSDLLAARDEIDEARRRVDERLLWIDGALSAHADSR